MQRKAIDSLNVKKVCNGFLCKGTEKVLSEFGCTKGKPRRVCKKCKNHDSAIFYKNNTEKCKLISKNLRINNIEKEKVRHQKYYIENRDKILDVLTL